jgi:hypothetical protein
VEHSLLRNTLENVEASYRDGQPLHRLPNAQLEEYDPSASCIFTVEWEKFKTMSASTLQSIFRHRHILVLDAPVETAEFDKEGLESLGSLTSVRSVQGMSSCIFIFAVLNENSVGEFRLEGEDSMGMNKPGTLEELYMASVDSDNQRVWNFLDLPMGHVTQNEPPKFR